MVKYNITFHNDRQVQLLKMSLDLFEIIYCKNLDGLQKIDDIFLYEGWKKRILIQKIKNNELYFPPKKERMELWTQYQKIFTNLPNYKYLTNRRKIIEKLQTKVKTCTSLETIDKSK